MASGSWAATLAVAVTLSAQPATPDRDRSLEREARAIDAMLVAPCCYSQQVSVHQSEAADRVRRDVRDRLIAGQSRDQIVAEYVRMYGKRILAEPPAAGFDLTLYVLPVLLLFATFGVVAVAVRRLARAPAGAASVEPFAATADEQARLDDELRDMD